MMGEERAKEMALLAAETLAGKKAEDVAVLPVGKVSPIADYFVLATAGNERHITALQGHVEEALVRGGFPSARIEGKNGSTWVLMDFGDVIVHLFSREDRSFYDLERVWKDAGTLAWDRVSQEVE